LYSESKDKEQGLEKALYDNVNRLQDEHWWFASRRRFVREVLDKAVISDNAAILDIGCGSGAMIDFLHNYGKFVAGIDYSAYAIKLCAENGHKDLVRGTVENLPFIDGAFDLITSFEVLYHKAVGDDSKVIKEMYRVCKKGGKVLVVDSAFNFLKGKHDDFAHGARRYTVKQLSKKLEDSGFRIRKASYIYMAIFPLLCVIRAAKNIFLPKSTSSSELHPAPRFLNDLMIKIFEAESAMLGRMSLPFGVSLICLAEKVR
jgi:ubiquinone/menaquinone biosynthesis C-methylase UbiE